MRLGIISELIGDVVEFAGANNLGALELVCDRGKQIDPETMSGQDIKDLKERLDRNNVTLSSLGWVLTNGIELDPAVRKDNLEYFKKMVDLGNTLGSSMIAIGTQHHPSMKVKEHLQETLDIFEETFSVYAEEAGKAGMCVVVENCPELGNIAYSPEIIRLILKRIPNKAFGLEYDPSHLIWQGIDYIRYLKEFGDRIYAVHGKDTRILEDNLYNYGVFGKMNGEATEADSYWRYCIPGFGKVDWSKVFYTLYEIGFDGDVFVENEDELFAGGPFFVDDPEILNKRYRGVLLTKKHLEQFMV